MNNNFTNPPSGHPPIKTSDIVIGAILVAILTIVTLFFMSHIESHTTRTNHTIDTTRPHELYFDNVDR